MLSTVPFTLSFRLQGGLISVVEDLGTISYNVWAKVKRSLGDFQVSGRADVSSDATDIVDMDLRVEGEVTMAQVSATVGTHSELILFRCKMTF